MAENFDLQRIAFAKLVQLSTESLFIAAGDSTEIKTKWAEITFYKRERLNKKLFGYCNENNYGNWLSDCIHTHQYLRLGVYGPIYKRIRLSFSNPAYKPQYDSKEILQWLKNTTSQ